MRTETTRSTEAAARLVPVALATLAALLGCGATEPTVPVEEARAHRGEVVRLQGFAVERAGSVRLCERLSPSTPPGCAGRSLRVDGLTAAELDGVRRKGSVAWTEDRVTVLGKVEADVLTRLARQ